ncbi:hypothetical protein QAD02_001419 [Eretmocerus hayati]|uniref:Uncharacterized protein n=1 Tax=Eretmocerus hayati TaxID=131215 RepID=A0ACC2NG76_9HYME|nr:hypothetical protein QAD02_001419 [Eretmocerus hayati]
MKSRSCKKDINFLLKQFQYRKVCFKVPLLGPMARCNTSAKPPTPIRVVIAGGDGFVNAVLRQYVELLSFRPPDWQSYLRFLVVPLGVNGPTDSLSNDNASRVCEYLSSCANTLLLPIAEAMVTYRDTDDSGQIFVPFVNDVRVGCLEVNASASVELDEAGCAMVGFTGGTSSSTMASASFAGVSSGGFTGANSGSSPPSAQTTSGSNLPLSATSSAPSGNRLTPPSSPNVGQPREVGVWEQQPVELQLDYWGKPAQAGEKAKSSIRQAFRVLHVQRLPPLGEPPSQSLFISYMTKEKKQKIMRLGKKKEKEKENEPKSQQVDGVTRLICSAKTHNIPLRVSIDGTDWHGVKFFQLSAQWQTHIKTFPIAMPSYSSPGQPQPPSSLS